MEEKKIWLIRIIVVIFIIVVGFLEYKFFSKPPWQIALEKWLFLFFIALPMLRIMPWIRKEVKEEDKIFWLFWFLIMVTFLGDIYSEPRYSTEKTILLLAIILLFSIVLSIYLLRLKIKKKV
ncbi:MAG: hypothetical protein ABIM29_03645 [candidate division WOR-3 bacterium]